MSESPREACGDTAASEPLRASGAAGIPNGLGSDPLRVLLVDDQQLVRSGFSLMLSVEDDLEVVGEAGNGADAITRARQARPDVVLMDVQMPVMDGIEATRQIVAEDLGRVIILTTFDRDDYLFDALDAGASGFLLKNCGPEQLVDAVRATGHGHALLAPEVTRRVIEQMTRGRAASTRASYAGPPDAPTPMTPSRPAARDSPAAPADHDAPPAVAAHDGPSTPASRPAPATTSTRSTDSAELTRLTPREREVLVLMGRGLSNAEIADHLVLGEATVKTHVSNCLAKLHLRDRVHAVIYAYKAGLVGDAD